MPLIFRMSPVSASAGIALRLRDQRLALEVGKRIHFRVGERDDLEVLRIEVRHLADLGRLLGIRRPALDAIDGGGRVGEADLRLAFVDAADVGDSGARLLLDLQSRDRVLPHVLQRAAERNPRSALRTGHEGDLLGRGRNGKRDGDDPGTHPRIANCSHVSSGDWRRIQPGRRCADRRCHGFWNLDGKRSSAAGPGVTPPGESPAPTARR